MVAGQTKLRPFAYSIEFGIKNFGVTVTGKLTGLQATLQFSPGNLAECKLHGTVDVNTINTGNETRDSHLQKPEYFDAASYPQIELTSSKIYKKGQDYAGLFTLTIKGKTREMEIPFSYKDCGADVCIASKFTINRRDFGVGGSSMIMGDEVSIHILLTAKKM